MSKKLIIVLVVLTIIVFGAYFLINMGVLKKKPEVSLVLKTPVLQMVSTQDPEINDSYTFAKKIAKAFEEQYKDAKVTIKVVQFAKEDENKQILDAFNTANATDILFEEYMNMSTYIHTGNVVPLDDIITDEI